MQDHIAQRLIALKARQQTVQKTLESLAQQQQALMQEALQLMGAIGELEAIVVAVPDPVPMDGVQP